MSFPGIFRRLFTNNGAGPLLRGDIIPPCSCCVLNCCGHGGKNRIYPRDYAQNGRGDHSPFQCHEHGSQPDP